MLGLARLFELDVEEADALVELAVSEPSAPVVAEVA